VVPDATAVALGVAQAKIVSLTKERDDARKERDEAVQKHSELKNTMHLQVKLAMAETKMKAGGLMLARFGLGSGGSSGRSGSSAETATPGSAAGAATPAQVLTPDDPMCTFFSDIGDASMLTE